MSKLILCRCGRAKYAALDRDGNWIFFCTVCDGIPAPEPD